jgi:hypothetical protein
MRWEYLPDPEILKTYEVSKIRKGVQVTISQCNPLHPPDPDSSNTYNLEDAASIASIVQALESGAAEVSIKATSGEMASSAGVGDFKKHKMSPEFLSVTIVLPGGNERQQLLDLLQAV